MRFLLPCILACSLVYAAPPRSVPFSVGGGGVAYVPRPRTSGPEFSPVSSVSSGGDTGSDVDIGFNEEDTPSTSTDTEGERNELLTTGLVSPNFSPALRTPLVPASRPRTTFASRYRVEAIESPAAEEEESPIDVRPVVPLAAPRPTLTRISRPGAIRPTSRFITPRVTGLAEGRPESSGLYRGEEGLAGLHGEFPKPEPYAYSINFETDDGASSSHEQSGNEEGVVRGSYTINMPDGSSRTVTYIADKDGYRPTITTNEKGTRTVNPASASFVSTSDFS